MESFGLVQFHDAVMNELEKLGMDDLSTLIISEKRISVEEFSAILAQQIFESFNLLSVDDAAKSIYTALYNVYVKRLTEEGDNVTKH